MDLVIKNGRVVTAGDIFEADIGVAGEKIVAIGKALAGALVIDAAGRLVFPGGVDVHVHLQMPLGGGLVSRDDFASGSAAAACGGTTTLIDFIEAERGTSLLEATRQRRAEADGRCAIDYSLHLTGNCAEPAFLDEIGALAGQGYTSLKLYTTYEGLRVEDAEILALLETARRYGLLPIVHAENHAIMEREKRRLLAAGCREPRYHPISRPAWAEAEAAGRVLALARSVGVPVYFVHVSAAETLEVIARARRAGQIVYAEVTPQHLLLDDAEYARPGFEGARFCCAPPLRTKADQEALWWGLAVGAVQTVATDHCPWDYATDRQRGKDDFTQIPNGLAGIETRLALLYSEGVAAGRLSLNRFVDVCATTPAKLFGLYPQKGSIIVGGDADLVIWDAVGWASGPPLVGRSPTLPVSQREITLSASRLHMRTDDCPFEGWPVRGRAAWVLSRGRVLVRDGEFVGPAGEGRFVARQRLKRGVNS